LDGKLDTREHDPRLRTLLRKLKPSQCRHLLKLKYQVNCIPLDISANLTGTGFNQFIVLGALELDQTFNQNSIYVQFQNLLDASIAIQALTNPLLSVFGVFMGWLN
jgi:hypothetical protein